MSMTYYERKALLYHGAVSDVSQQLGCAIGKVSEHLKDGGPDRAVLHALAKRMRRPDGQHVTVTEAFGRPKRARMRKPQPAAV
jgi:hypothetical protein